MGANPRRYLERRTPLLTKVAGKRWFARQKQLAVEVGPHLADGVVRSFHLENEGMPRPRASKPVDRDKQQGEYKRCPSRSGGWRCLLSRDAYLWASSAQPPDIKVAKGSATSGVSKSSVSSVGAAGDGSVGGVPN